MSKTYWEKLKDPRWQRRKSEKQIAADFACEECGDKTSTLHVHHRIYRRGAEPWEYADNELELLCENCHDAAEADKDHVKETMVHPGFEKLIVLVARAANYEEGKGFGNRYAGAMHHLKTLLILTESMEWLLRDLRTITSIPRYRYDALMKSQKYHRENLDNLTSELRGALDCFHADELAALKDKPIIESGEKT